MTVIDMDSIRFVYPAGTVALHGVSLAVEGGESLAIIGQNGAGKTTLIKMAIGLLRPTEGTVSLFGEDIRTTSTAKIARKVGFVFQNPRTQIFLGSVQAEAEFGPKKIGMSEEMIREQVGRALEWVGLSSQSKTHPYDMTPADRKLLTIASIISMDPQILILDEPTGGMDFISTNRVVAAVEAFLAQGRTVITVAHDMDFVARCFKRVVVMNQGLVVADGQTSEIFSRHDLLAGTHLEPTAISQLAASCSLPKSLLTVDDMAGYVKDKKGLMRS